MTVVQPGQGRALNPEMTLKVGTHDLPHGSLSVVEGILAPKQFIGPHTHSREDEVTLVLEGQIVALVGDILVEVSAGSFLLKPAGVMHAFGNPGREPARVHELHAPGGLEEFYEAMHLNFSDLTSPRSRSTRPFWRAARSSGWCTTWTWRTRYDSVSASSRARLPSWKAPRVDLEQLRGAACSR
jgi:mannose-6-phosphate isomerase-like protein (cupin superfamily)